MPRGQKSRLRAREKRRQVQDEAQGLGVDQGCAAEREELPSSPSAVSARTPPSSPAAGSPEQPQGARATGSPEAGASCPRDDLLGGDRQAEGSPRPSQATASAGSSRRDPLTRKAIKLVLVLLDKYKVKEPITQAALLKIVNKKYKEHFSEILRRASEHLELVSGLELNEVDRSNHIYALVSKLDFTCDGKFSHEKGLPKTGLLMSLLGIIFMKGNRATEEEIWEFLHTLGVYPGQSHLIFGEPRKLITKDLVQEKYLEYRQLPHSDPPRYEFLWGPRAHAETSKMKVLKVLAKINDSTPSCFPDLYQEALQDDKEKAATQTTARAASAAEARECGSGQACAACEGRSQPAKQ